jgi:hypothetical protein
MARRKSQSNTPDLLKRPVTGSNVWSVKLDMTRGQPKLRLEVSVDRSGATDGTETGSKLGM